MILSLIEHDSEREGEKGGTPTGFEQDLAIIFVGLEFLHGFENVYCHWIPLR